MKYKNIHLHHYTELCNQTSLVSETKRSTHFKMGILGSMFRRTDVRRFGGGCGMPCRLNVIIECEGLDGPLRSCSQVFREEKFLLGERMHYSVKS